MRWWLCLLLWAFPVAATDTAAAWQAWRDGQAVLILRHALAPGVGDPVGFVLDDCRTQRNLNLQGQQQAKAWGDKLRQLHDGAFRLYSSQWCRCLDTAHLMAVAEVKPLPALNSFFAGRGNAQAQTQALLRDFADSKSPEPLILITHQVNFTELTGMFPQSAAGALVALPLTQPARVLAQVQLTE